MIISFLGKGGSGKSSLATQMMLHLNGKKQILAIDADHNMDFIFNAAQGDVPDMNQLGQAMSDVLDYVGLEDGDAYTQAFLEETSQRFSFANKIDSFTKKYATKLENGVYTMASGPQTDRVLYGKSCSHFLSTPLKVYLPLLELDDESVVLVDEKAGADGASTGIVSGVDVGVIVSEPSVHGIKTANQIAELLDFFGTPYILVGNKITSKEDEEFIRHKLSTEPAAFIESNQAIKRNPFAKEAAFADALKDIYRLAEEQNNNDRLQRTVAKFERNASFQS